VGAGLPAMVVNDNAGELDKRGALESIASWLAPTVSAWAWPLVGASLLAMVVNDNAGDLDKRGTLESIASWLAPTVSAWARPFVGAGLPAMGVSDNAGELDQRGALESIASRLAPMYGLAPTVYPLLKNRCPVASMYQACSWKPSSASGQHWISARYADYREASKASRSPGINPRRSDLGSMFFSRGSDG
jgi:hypothetical protein